MAIIKNPLMVITGGVTPAPTNIIEKISYYADRGEAATRYPAGILVDVTDGQIVTTEIASHFTLRITGHNGVIVDGDTQKSGRPQCQVVRVLSASRAFGSSNTTSQSEWRNCTLRDWLNSESGFLPEVPDILRNAVKTSVVSTCPNGSSTPYTTNDKFYLYSQTEVGGLGSGAQYTEGVQQDYYKTTDAPSNNASIINARRVAYDSGGSARLWWLRSAYQGGSLVWNVSTAGGASYYGSPTGSFYVRPACNL